jgi:hypothetical protein
MLRLARLARTLRLFKQFRELWMLVRGLMTSAGTMLYTCFLLFILLYLFACLGFELITNDPELRKDPAIDLHVEMYFGSIPGSMKTLGRFVMLDSSAVVIRPLVLQNSSLAIFFTIVVLVLSVSLMNLVTGIVVEGSLEQADEDREAAKQVKIQQVVNMLPRFEQLFRELDTDGSGLMSMSELQAAPAGLAEELLNSFQTEDLHELFEMLDCDRSGTISIEELCHELVKTIITDRSIDSLRMQKHSTTLRNQLTNLIYQMESYEAERQMEIGYLRENLAALRSTLESKGKSALPIGGKPSES